MPRWVVLFFLSSVFLRVPLFAEFEARQPHVYDETYGGEHPAVFQSLRYQVPILVRQTLIELSGRLGLNYQDGWRYPLTIGFVDGGPAGAENVLAFVAYGTDGRGFRQMLGINLDAYSRTSFNFEKVFAHELVHAMLNDALGAEAAGVVPVWFHEGLAVYGADQGEQMLRSYIEMHPSHPEKALLNGLDGPHGALDYAEDYLAFRYIYSAFGNNGLHNFVREVARNQGDVAAAMRTTCNTDWDSFQKDARAWAEKEIERIQAALRGTAGRPY